jgi:hypothetical protein
MILSMNARPAPGTTELLEVLDRALAGGIIIEQGHRLDSSTSTSANIRTKVVVAAVETYLKHADAGATGHSIVPPTDEVPSAKGPR